MWYFMQGGMRSGPISDGEFSQQITSGGITAQTPVWREGMANWLPAGSVPEWSGSFVVGSMPPGYPPAAQPGTFVPQAPRVPDYLVWAILEILFCCLPFGIVGLIYAVQANSAKDAGRFAAAQENAAKAKMYLIIGMLFPFVAFIGYFFLMIFAVIMGSLS